LPLFSASLPSGLKIRRPNGAFFDGSGPSRMPSEPTPKVAVADRFDLPDRQRRGQVMRVHHQVIIASACISRISSAQR